MFFQLTFEALPYISSPKLRKNQKYSGLDTFVGDSIAWKPVYRLAHFFSVLPRGYSFKAFEYSNKIVRVIETDFSSNVVNSFTSLAQQLFSQCDPLAINIICKIIPGYFFDNFTDIIAV